mmetsp:Transcript_56318/g.168601  ORF Transcript_56318/g.168601 Transcript_56318/m.168601 type:complete len:331 (-) Transcript_56318:582-1574(-)|eukprot:CAMPEP_0113562550 /NCGR_PEP_ID=MMETSP0015_2-20120614/20589_1 /TAXON_ID=2838 /ORGANISM="Odontella" /LENGTH=330 /DNA_ID=CAMNT_0000464459 /DNA_START=10 /DNA_END=1002 /DNA_ORIENTATION=+ /assembly_acc=CAM_ASM_000160
MLTPASLVRLSSMTFGILSSSNTPNECVGSQTALQSTASSAPLPPAGNSTSPSSSIAPLPDRASAFLSSLPPLLPGRKRIYLLRHGETEWNARGLMQGGGYDIPLNDGGYEQARCAAEALSGIPLDAVASSHLLRARQTADVIHDASQSDEARKKNRSLSSASSPPSRLIEVDFGEMRFGDLEGNAIHGPEATDETRRNFAEMNDAMAEDGRLTWPGEGAESIYDVEARARRGFNRLVQGGATGESDNGGSGVVGDDWRHLAVVAHGRHNKVLLASLLWGDALDFRSIKQGNTCINVIDWEADAGEDGGGKAVEVLINYVDHAEVDDRHR